MVSNSEVGAGHGHPKRGRQEWNVLIANADLDFKEFPIKDSEPTGRQIVRAFTKGDPDEFIALQWLPDGRLEDLAPDEQTDLEKEDGPEKFIVVRSDRTYRLEIEGTRQEWPLKVITGATVKVLAERDPSKFDVFLVRKDEPDLELSDHDTASLDGEGLERFEIRPREHVVVVKVNNKAVRIERGSKTGLEIKQAAISQSVQIQLDFVLTLIRTEGATKVIGDGDIVQVRTDLQFTAIADDDNS